MADADPAPDSAQDSAPDLPPELLAEIMGHLDSVWDVLRAAGVCRAWRGVALDVPSVLGRHTLTVHPRMSADTLEAVCFVVGGTLGGVELRRRNLDAEDGRGVSTLCERLRRVTLTEAPRSAEGLLDSLSFSATFLRELHIRSGGIHLDTLVQALAVAHSLETLDVAARTGIVADDLDDVAQLLDDHALAMLGEAVRGRLRRLRLRGCPRITAAGLVAVAHGGELVELDVRGCGRVHVAELAAVVEQQGALEMLGVTLRRIASLAVVTVYSLEEDHARVATLAVVLPPSLRRLAVEGLRASWEGTTSSDVAARLFLGALVARCPQLVELDARPCALDAHCLGLVAQLPRLEVLDVADSYGLIDENVGAVAPGMARLRRATLPTLTLVRNDDPDRGAFVTPNTALMDALPAAVPTGAITTAPDLRRRFARDAAPAALYVAAPLRDTALAGLPRAWGDSLTRLVLSNVRYAGGLAWLPPPASARRRPLLPRVEGLVVSTASHVTDAMLARLVAHAPRTRTLRLVRTRAGHAVARAAGALRNLTTLTLAPTVMAGGGLDALAAAPLYSATFRDATQLSTDDLVAFLDVDATPNLGLLALSFGTTAFPRPHVGVLVEHGAARDPPVDVVSDA
jgi:hypothetical protein